MRYLWLLPPELSPQLATLLIMLCGVAIMFQQRALAVSLFGSAVLLLAAPAFDPAINAAVDTAFGVGEHYLRSWSWWAVSLALVITLLLIFRAIVGFIFGREVGNQVTANLISSGVEGVIRVLIVRPARALGWLPWPARAVVIVAFGGAAVYIFA